MGVRALYACRECGYRSPKWLGRCPECDAWGALVQGPAAAKDAASAARPAELQPFPDIDISDRHRIRTGSAELDRVLGGGLVPGAVVLLGGEPGVGKSTLLLQAASAIADSGRKVVYLSGEESPSQLRARGDRLAVRSSNLLIVSETAVAAALAAVREARPALIVIDSIQAVRCDDVDGIPGSVSQVRESATRLVSHAKTTSTPILLVGHVTKDGGLAGPRLLEHIVDAVLQFDGDRHHEHRILRAVKNRFGRCHELGVFTMTATGLREVPDPSEFLLSQRVEGAAGSAILAAVEGSRPLLVELQSLVGEPVQGTPRRTALGIDSNRVAMILAVLQRSTGLQISNRDVFVNVTGGLTVHEPAADLAVACAVASSALGRALPERTVVAGEIGLTGEIRSLPRLADRLREANRLGLERALVPPPGDAGAGPGRLRTTAVATLSEAFRVLFGEPRAPQIG